MTEKRSLLEKIKRKGLIGSARLLWARCVYRHDELIWMERALDLPAPRFPRHSQWRQIRITEALLPAFDRYFSLYKPGLPALIHSDSLGEAFLDADGQVIGMAWFRRSDYYDDQTYHCWLRLPPGRIYQFAGEVAPPYRGSGMAVLLQREPWKVFLEEGFSHTRAVVNMNNTPALRMHVKLGFEEIGESIHLYRLFNCLKFHRFGRYDGKRLCHLRRSRPSAQTTQSTAAEHLSE
jgi:ribosomal protein S18 acetylase RimI-like enzyme